MTTTGEAGEDRAGPGVDRLGRILLERGWRVTTAESCTGGLIAGALTEIAGSSAWFEYGFVTYGNNAKSDMLGVSDAMLQAHGAVSEPVAVAMAEGARQRAGAEIAVSVTGIAGPDGGTPTKPVGTVWMAWAVSGRDTVARRFRFDGDRAEVRRQTLEQAIDGLISHAQGM